MKNNLIATVTLLAGFVAFVPLPAQETGLRVTVPALCSRCRAGGWIETPRCQFDNLADAV